MKNLLKTITLLFTALLFVNHLNAQIGIKAGYNLSSLKYFTDSDNNFDEEFISGYQIGLVYNVGLGDKLSFQPEAAFYTTGGKSDFFNVELRRIYNFAKFNGLVNYNLIGSNDGISLHLTGGLFAAYAINAQLESSSLGTEDISFKDQDVYERTNVGYIIGAGVKVNRFMVSVRGSIGLSSLVNFEVAGSNGSVSDAEVKSREFSLVGIVFF